MGSNNTRLILCITSSVAYFSAFFVQYLAFLFKGISWSKIAAGEGAFEFVFQTAGKASPLGTLPEVTLITPFMSHSHNYLQGGFGEVIFIGGRCLPSEI